MLLQRANAQAASNRENLPPEIRNLYLQAFNTADLALGLQDARARKTAPQSSTMPFALPVVTGLPSPALPLPTQLQSLAQTPD